MTQRPLHDYDKEILPDDRKLARATRPPLTASRIPPIGAVVAGSEIGSPRFPHVCIVFSLLYIATVS